MDSAPQSAPQPARCHVRVESDGRALTLTYSQRRWGLAVILAAFLTGWSAGCVMLVQLAIQKQDGFTWVFATPFLVGWAVVASALLAAISGTEKLRVGPDGLSHERRGALGRSRRDIPLGELKNFSAETTRGDSDSTPVTFVGVASIGRPLRFASGITLKEAAWLAELLRSHVYVLSGDEEPRGASDDDADDIAAGAEAETPEPTTSDSAKRNWGRKPRLRTVVLEPAERPLSPPSDCGPRLREGFDGAHFECRGRWSLATILGVTLINGFWNGIVAVFVIQLFRDFQWILFCFLIPFELVGLVMVLVWIAALFAPAIYLCWSFGGYEITWRSSFFGIGLTRRFAVNSLDRIELHEYASSIADQSQPFAFTGQTGDFALSFVTRDNQVLVEISRLTEGEARWIADVVYRQCSVWFPRR